jgi:hypothetical protein
MYLLFVTVILAALYGWANIPTPAEVNYKIRIDEGIAESYASNLLAFHSAAIRYYEANPLVRGEIPFDSVVAAMQTYTGAGMTINAIGPWHAAVGNPGTLVTWMQGDVKSVLAGQVGAALTRVARHDPGAGVVHGNQLVPSTGAPYLPLPAGATIPEGSVAYGSRVYGTVKAPHQDVVDVLTLEGACPFPQKGQITYMQIQVTRDDGSTLLGPEVEVGNTCDPGLRTVEWKTDPCAAPLIGVTFSKRYVDHQSGTDSFGPWVASGQTCSTGLVSTSPLPGIDPPRPIETLIGETTETAEVPCATGYTGTTNYQRTITSFSTTYGILDDYGTWTQTSTSCAPAVAANPSPDPSSGDASADGPGNGGHGGCRC